MVDRALARVVGMADGEADEIDALASRRDFHGNIEANDSRSHQFCDAINPVSVF